MAAKQGWDNVKVGRDAHVIPARDLQPHRKSRQCPCEPKFESEGYPAWEGDDLPLVVIHTAYDGRE